MDNKAVLLREYSALITERNRLEDYLCLRNLAYAETILASMELGEIEKAITVVGERLTRINAIDALLADL